MKATRILGCLIALVLSGQVTAQTNSNSGVNRNDNAAGTRNDNGGARNENAGGTRNDNGGTRNDNAGGTRNDNGGNRNDNAAGNRNDNRGNRNDNARGNDNSGRNDNGAQQRNDNRGARNDNADRGNDNGAGGGVGGITGGAIGGASGRAMSANEVADMFRNVRHSLGDSIRVAEQHTQGGKAFRAECRMGDAAGAGDRGTTDANRNNDNANRTNDNNRVNDNNRGGANAAGGNIICVVWVITANSKIVEVQVDANTGKVIGQREGANTNDFGMRTSPVEIPGVNNLPWTAGRPEAALTAMLAVAALGEPKPGQPDQPDRVHNADSMHDFARATRWQKGSDLIGKDITNDSNEDLGKLKDIVVDAKNGRILYGVVTFGGFMGMGNKLFAIPWQSLQLQPDYKKLVLNVPKEQLKNAEGFDESNWPKFADEQWATKTYEFYGHKPYWRTPAGEVASDNYRGRWYHQVSEWAKASDLIGKNVKNPQDEGVGEIKDLAVDPDAGRVIYGILGYSGHRYAIPWQAFDLTGDQKHLVLNVTKTDLDESVAFKGEDWPNLTDEAWSTRIYTHYHVTPYWIDRTND